MSTIDDPLNEVSLNTLSNNSQNNNVFAGKTQYSHFLRDQYTAINIENGIGKINQFIKLGKYGKLQMIDIHDTVLELFKILLKIHSVNQIRNLIRLYLMIIGKYITDGQYSRASLEIIELYNSTTIKKAHNFTDILLADITKFNQIYISSMKIFVIQIIIKTKTVPTYENALIELFAYDERYLLRDPKVKIHVLNKLLLNLYTVDSKNKPLYGLKFLKYIEKYNLQFNEYIKNIDELTFRQQIIKFYQKDQSCKRCLNIYYMDYSRHTKGLEKLMLSEISPDIQNSFPKFKNYKDTIKYAKEGKECHCLDIEDIARLVLFGTKIVDHEVISLNDKLSTIIYIWNLLVRESVVFDVRQKILYDKSLQFLNSNLNDMKCESVKKLTESLRKIALNFNQYQRLENLVNVIFNISIIMNNQSFLLLAVETELLSSHSLGNTTEISYVNMIRKMDKFLQGPCDEKTKVDIFSQYYNILNILQVTTLQDLQHFCEMSKQIATKRLRMDDFGCINEASEIMIVLLGNKTDDENNTMEDNNVLTNMLYCIVNGDFKNDIRKLGQTSNKFHFLHQYEILILSVYHFYLNMRGSVTGNMRNIIETYKNKWFSRQNELQEVSQLEINFLKSVFSHLIFIQFDKLALELMDLIASNPYYSDLLSVELILYSMKSVSRLELFNKMDILRLKFMNYSFELKKMKLKKLLDILEIYTIICLWYNDISLFAEIFQGELKVARPELFDINNQKKLPIKSYIEILIFNVKLYNTASKLQSENNHVLSSIIENKRSVKLSMSLLKMMNKVDVHIRHSLIQNLTDCYISLLDVHIRAGLSRDTDYYIKEITKIVDSLQDPPIILGCLHAIQNYYFITKMDSLRMKTSQQSNKIFNHICSEEDILSLTIFLNDNSEYQKLEKCISLFFGDEITSTNLSLHWKVKLGKVVPMERDLPSHLKEINLVNRVEDSYKSVMKQLQSDPFFKNISESAIATPSIRYNGKHGVKPVFINNFDKNITNSPRSSNMTPKSKTLLQKFDRAVVIDNLRKTLQMALKISPYDISHISLLRIVSIFSTCCTVLSNISLNACEALDEQFYLSDVARYMPQYYDKLLSKVNSKLYKDFILLNFEVKNELPSIIKAEQLFQKDKCDNQEDFCYDIICIDICPATGNLLLSKVHSYDNEKRYLNIPLNGAYFRDLDGIRLTYSDAVNELTNIIESSNKSVSREVTSTIATSEDRKGWWHNRYDLDKKLGNLLQKIEKSWFGGFKSFFSHKKINETHFKEFVITFYEILHKNLPSRKNMGRPNSFLQLEDWVLELFLNLDPSHGEFLSMVEDLMYFIFDILLYHGEENAYDEIDTSVLHFEIEDAIRKYHSQCGLGVKKRVQHTFLVVGSRSHMFPWESMSFMKELSISRVPSIQSLNEIIKRNHGEARINVQIKSNIAMILNPGSDLGRTEDRFSEALTTISNNSPGSTLSIREKPSEQYFLSMIQHANLFIYVGHGGGEQYIRNSEIKKQEILSPSFLLGCSSATMKDYGDLGSTGLMYSYLMGGSPLILGNLWDVTDKDIDKFSMSVFEKIGLIRNVATSFDEGISISDAVLESRGLCNLRYLNGAAPVVYGLPAKFI